uniref:Uncharacterized protein n=1 Tax=Caenorhabditis japonica TaxID=281687 RepID=A0A8R1EET5_CAEJA
MALKTRTQDFPELENYLFDWSTSNVFIKNVSQFLLEVEELPTQFATKANRFKDIGDEFTKLKKVPAIPLDFVGLTSIIESLKCSSFGLSDELNNAEESLEGLSLLQYSSQPLDEHITEKLVKTEKALRNLFGKAVTLSPSWVDIVWFVVSAVFWLILCVVAIVASTILGIVISWIKEGWEKYEEQKRLGS